MLAQVLLGKDTIYFGKLILLVEPEIAKVSNAAHVILEVIQG